MNESRDSRIMAAVIELAESSEAAPPYEELEALVLERNRVADRGRPSLATTRLVRRFPSWTYGAAALAMLVLIAGVAWLVTDGSDRNTVLETSPAERLVDPTSSPAPVIDSSQVGDAFLWEQIALPPIADGAALEIFDDDEVVYLVERIGDVDGATGDLNRAHTLDGGLWRSVSVAAPGTIEAAWDGTLVLVEGETVSLVDAATGSVGATYEFGVSVREVAYGPSGLIARANGAYVVRGERQEPVRVRTPDGFSGCCVTLASTGAGFFGMSDREGYTLIGDSDEWIEHRPTPDVSGRECCTTDLIAHGDDAFGISGTGYHMRLSGSGDPFTSGLKAPNDGHWDVASDGTTIAGWHRSERAGANTIVAGQLIRTSSDGRTWQNISAPHERFAPQARIEAWTFADYNRINNGVAVSDGAIHLVGIDRETGEYQLWRGVKTGG